MKKNSNAELLSLPPVRLARQSVLSKSVAGGLVGLWILYMSVIPANALYITDDLEMVRIPDTSSTWETVSTQNSYSNPAVVCTYALPSSSDNEAVVRIRNTGSTGFDVRIQRPLNSSSVTASDVYCLVADAGDYTLPSPDGRAFDAHMVASDGTNHGTAAWAATDTEDVSGFIGGAYRVNSQPVVLGQVMSYNDSDFSAFWSFDCNNRRTPPFASTVDNTDICVGKHTGQNTDPRNNETLGYIVIAEGSSSTGSFGGISYRVELGGDSIRGVGNGTPYTYALSSHYHFAVATQEAMDGGQGGWAVMYGADPLDGNNIDLAIDEETVAGDTTRKHTTEQVAYWAFRGIDHGDAPSSYGDASHLITVSATRTASFFSARTVP
jgi:hypothetical protein